MKIYYLVVFFALFSPAMPGRHKKLKTIKMTTKQKCEKIKCPPIDDPVCVKIKNKHREIYIIAVNKCEIKYASCHKDVDATIVPMVNCVHDEKKNQNTTSKRNKRDVQESGDDINTFKMSYDSGHTGNLKLNYQTKEDEDEGPKLLKGQFDDNDDDDGELLKGETDNSVRGDEEELNGESDDNENGGDGHDQLLKDESEGKDGESADKVMAVTDEDQQNLSVLDENNSENSNKTKKKSLNDVEDDTKEEINDNNIKLISTDYIAPDYNLLQNEAVDENENNKNCPTVCPSRDVMVCAKCAHNIHRTFLSTCHLRMFACKHSKEKLQLVKREPCIQSAPYISEFKDTKGTVPESGEMDEVHKFIFCRNKKLQNKDDPRCKV